MSWQEFGETAESDDEQAITLGDLRGGESVTITVREDPEQFESEQYGPGLRVPSTFHSSDYDFQTEDGDTINEMDDVTLVTWSKRLGAALAGYADDNDGVLLGEKVEVTKEGTGYDTTYTVESAE